MPARREQILARLFVVLQSVPGVAECARNRGDLQSPKRPFILLLDADEAADRTSFNRGRPSNSPNLITLSPEIYVTMQNKKPKNETIGTDLNALCTAVIKAVITDAELNEIVGGNGEIRYEGLATDLGEDRTQEGKARVAIAFVYPFIPGEL